MKGRAASWKRNENGGWKLTFKEKCCVVTGAGSGIGRAIALQLAEQGATLALSDIDDQSLRETQALIGQETANNIRFDHLDVSDADAIIRYAQIVKDSFGDADAVFNVAGLSRMGEFEETSLEAFERVIDVNFWGVVRMSKAFLPQLIERKGVLVNISSIFGMIGVPGQAHYCASKFAVRGFNESLSQELKGKGVAVTSVHPGGVKTNIARNAVQDGAIVGMGDGEKAVKNFDKMARQSPEAAARTIIKGALARKSRVLVGHDAHVISFVQRLFPKSYRALIGWLQSLGKD